MATLLELAKIKHHAVRSDGAKFLDGERTDSLNTSWLTVNSSGRVTLAPGLYDELLVVKGEVSEDQIKAWAAMGAPFYDPSPVIQENQIPAAETWNKAVRDAQGALAAAADAQATADGKVTTFYQATAPAATGIGDIWFDTSDHNHRYWWDGAKWADVSDTSPVDANQRPISARGLGGDIEMDHTGMRFIRKADGKVTLQMDIETGSAYFRGDITGASGTFSGGVAGGNGAFELTPSKLIINTPQFALDEGGNALFSGDITGASGTFSGNLAAESIEYTNLKIAHAKVTSATSFGIPEPVPATYIHVATSQNDWNEVRWPEQIMFATLVSEETYINLYHNPLSLLSGGIIIQISPNGTSWTDEIDMAYQAEDYSVVSGGVSWKVRSRCSTSTRFAFILSLPADQRDNSRTIRIRFKRHAIM